MITPGKTNSNIFGWPVISKTNPVKRTPAPQFIIGINFFLSLTFRFTTAIQILKIPRTIQVPMNHGTISECASISFPRPTRRSLMRGSSAHWLQGMIFTTATQPILCKNEDGCQVNPHERVSQPTDLVSKTEPSARTPHVRLATSSVSKSGSQNRRQPRSETPTCCGRLQGAKTQDYLTR
jgi:hypothetical protein